VVVLAVSTAQDYGVFGHCQVVGTIERLSIESDCEWQRNGNNYWPTHPALLYVHPTRPLSPSLSDRK